MGYPLPFFHRKRPAWPYAKLDQLSCGLEHTSFSKSRTALFQARLTIEFIADSHPEHLWSVQSLGLSRTLPSFLGANTCVMRTRIEHSIALEAYMHGSNFSE